MQWYKDFANQITQVFNESQRVIATFPSPHNIKGLAYLSTFDAQEEESSKNYICYLLPFWLKELIPLKEEDYVKLSVGNVFAMLYFFIQDDIMDSKSTLDRDQIPLANLFHMQFLEIYRSYFPSDSPFWDYFHQYIIEWTDSVSNEHQQDYFQTNLVMTARKASPLKLSSTGALVLSGQSELIPSLSDFIDHVLITLQMSDDWIDWQDDWADGSYNGLLSMIQAENGREGALSLDHIKNAIYVRGIMKRYTEIASANHTYIQKLTLNIPYLASFHETLVEHLIKDANLIEKDKLLQEKGGLHYWLSKNMI
ncbi:hypothetical protein [Paenibacillus antarcticus]|uniref:Terpene synthase n=1 Tax=Paenibacillus antarcticus TaxID=253703 RepID=A0A168QTR5_9BACL|nr:hypothetical protein [Paenibacillus antarcticus]OAB48196.1 hypothetical protein PBAT_00715 [Paenibacillus antarcticus]